MPPASYAGSEASVAIVAEPSVHGSRTLLGRQDCSSGYHNLRILGEVDFDDQGRLPSRFHIGFSNARSGGVG